MIDQDYLLSLLVWGVLIGCSVTVELLLVPRNSRRRVVYSTLGFMIPLSVLGFVDGVSKQLGLVPCSGGVVFMASFFVMFLLMFDSLVLSKTSSAVSEKQPAE